MNKTITQAEIEELRNAKAKSERMKVKARRDPDFRDMAKKIAELTEENEKLREQLENGETPRQRGRPRKNLE